MAAPTAPIGGTMSDDRQLDRIETMLDTRLGAIDERLRELNGSVARHNQELYGATGRGGLVRDLAKFKEWTRERLDAISWATSGYTAGENAKRDTHRLAAAWAGVVVATISVVVAVWAVVS